MHFFTLGAAPDEVDLGQVANAVRAGRVDSLVVRGEEVDVYLRDGGVLTSRREPDAPLTDTLRNYGVREEELAAVALHAEAPWDWTSLLGWLVPLLFLVLIALFFLAWRRGNAATEGQDQLFNFGRSRARRISADRPSVTFADVAGVDEAKEELREVVEFLREPSRFLAAGAHVPKGLLLTGPPGTGKTLLARAVAGEARVPFFSMSGSEFVELFVGVGAARVRDLFQQARLNAPCIVFIDEIDAIGRRRGLGLGSANEEREQTLNQILVEMDGFDQRANVVVIAATNRPDILDPALLRPGRFDRRITLESPDVRERRAILAVHARGKRLAPDADLDLIARQTPGFSGADLENLLNEAAILAARQGRTLIGGADLEEAMDRVLAGPARRSRLLSDQEKVLVAYHEAGHALTAHVLPHLDPVHKVSIVARGGSGGHTRLLASEDRRLWTRSQLAEFLVFALGGLVAEELATGERSTGASDDLRQATAVARRMVAEYGMSARLGPLSVGALDGEGDHGKEPLDPRPPSEATLRLVEQEVRALLGQAYTRTRHLLQERRPSLDLLARQLIERETLHGPDLTALLGPPAEAHPSTPGPNAAAS
jgi:cell division protease FtsH